MELTTWLTSPSALSSPTERVNSWVRSSNSLNKRTFSMAITAWSAKVSSSLICCSGEGAHLGATNHDQSSNEFSLLARSGTAKYGAKPPSRNADRSGNRSASRHVRNVERCHARASHGQLSSLDQY